MIRASTTPRAAPMKGPRTVKCKAKGCLARFVPGADPRVTWCSEDCGLSIAMAAGEKRRAVLARADRAETRARKEAVKRRADHLADAQKAFNAWVRERDAHLPCICCGKFDVSDSLVGGGWDAGHYLSRGSHPHLRFDERNVFRQRKGCNRPGGTTKEAFRRGVVDRIGLAAVEALEADQTPARWTVDELIAIKKLYQLKLKQLRANK